MNHSLQGLEDLFGSVSMLDSDIPRQDVLDVGVEIPHYLGGGVHGISSNI